MKILAFLFVLVFIHTLPLWDYTEHLAGGLGDPLAHASIGNLYCNKILKGNSFTDTFMAPFGVDISGNYDSPFPFIATCAFSDFGSIFQFNLFTILQIILIIFSSFLVAQYFLKSRLLQLGYVLFSWWTGYYICKSHMHITLLSQIWGTQFVFFSISSLNIRSLKSILISSVLLGLSFIGTFQNIPGLFILTVGLLIFKLINIKIELKNFHSLKNLIIGFLLSISIFLIAWYPMIQFHLNNEIFLKPDSFRFSLSLKWIDLIVPFRTNYFATLFDARLIETESTNCIDFFIMISFIIFATTKKFWRSGINVALFSICLLYLFMSFGPQNKVNEILFQIFPFNLTRTPSRFAIEFYLCLLLVTFISYDKISNIDFKKYLSYFLIAWIAITGPILNQMLLFPTLSISSFLPVNGLQEFANISENQIVANIPAAWAGDQFQNFLQLFHHKNITSGYLAYPSYTQSLYKKSIENPFLTNLSCKKQPLEFIADKFMFDFNSLKLFLKTSNITLFIFDKNLLFTEPSCKELADWCLLFLKQPWMKIVDENNMFVLAKIIK